MLPVNENRNPSCDIEFPNSGNQSGMDIFRNAKTVRLRSHHRRYLIADEDEETVTQQRNGSTRNARWTVEFVSSEIAIRLQSCYGKYLSASNMPYLIGMTGRKVLQTLPRRLDSSVEWEPVKNGSGSTHVRLQTRYGNYLRANSRLPPWRNSVTHDVTHRTSTQDWVLWEVDVVEVLKQERKSPDPGPGYGHAMQQDLAPDPVHVGRPSSPESVDSDGFQRKEESDSVVHSPPKPDGRLIHYRVANERGDVDESVEAKSFLFKGHNVAGLTQKLEEETQLQDIFVCTRSPLNGKLFPLRLQLPPNNQEMHIVVVPSTSKCMSLSPLPLCTHPCPADRKSVV